MLSLANLRRTNTRLSGLGVWIKIRARGASGIARVRTKERREEAREIRIIRHANGYYGMYERKDCEAELWYSQEEIETKKINTFGIYAKIDGFRIIQEQ